jgi:hypothetical protein
VIAAGLGDYGMVLAGALATAVIGGGVTSRNVVYDDDHVNLVGQF